MTSQLGSIITNPDYASVLGILPVLKPDQVKAVVLDDAPLHGGNAEQVVLKGIEASSLDRLRDGGLVGVPAVGPTFDQFPAAPFLSADSLLQSVLLDIRGPCDQIVYAGEDVLDVLVGQERWQLEVVAGQLQIGLGPSAAVVLCLAEAAPLAAEEVAVTGEGQLGRRLQDFVRPAVEVVFGEREGADVLPSGLVDRHGHRVDVVDVIEQLQSAKAIAFHLGVILRRDQDAKTVLVIDHVHSAVRDQDGVGSAEALFDPAGEVHPLLNQDDRVSAGFLGSLYQFKDVGGIAGGAVVHLLIEPGEVLGGVFGLHPSAFRSLYSQSAWASVPSAA